MGQNLDKSVCCNQAENNVKPLYEDDPQQRDFNNNNNQDQQNNQQQQSYAIPSQRPEKIASNNNGQLLNNKNKNISNQQSSRNSLNNISNNNNKNIPKQSPSQNQSFASINNNNSADKNQQFQEQKKHLMQSSQNNKGFYDKLQGEEESVNVYHNNNNNNNGNNSNNLSMMNTAQRYNQRIEDLKDIVQYAPILQLTILSSATLQKGQILNVNCQGLTSSLRKGADGFTYFGCKKRQDRTKNPDYYEKLGFNSTNHTNHNMSDMYSQNQQQDNRSMIIDSDNEDEASYLQNNQNPSQNQLKQEYKNELNQQQNNNNNGILNDFIIPSQDPIIADRHRGVHFQIEYNIPQNNYRIKDLGIGFGAFYKLDFPLILKNNHLVNIGLIFMVVNFVKPRTKQQILQNQINSSPQKQQQQQYQLEDPEDYEEEFSDPENESQQENEQQQQQNDEKRNLKIKFFGGPCQGEKLVFSAKKDGRIINIGRSKDHCKPFFNDNLLSKIQCQIQYSEKMGWVLRDGTNNNNNNNSSGNSSKSQASTNGTWLYLGEEYTIYNGMIFKANQTLFQANIL